MIIRVVKLTFREEEVKLFLDNFKETKHIVRNYKGCTHLELLKVKNSTNAFMTYSYWEDEYYLEQYRKSDTFINIWSQVKKWFDKKPEAWTLTREIEL